MASIVNVTDLSSSIPCASCRYLDRDQADNSNPPSTPPPPTWDSMHDVAPTPPPHPYLPPTPSLPGATPPRQASARRVEGIHPAGRLSPADEAYLCRHPSDGTPPVQAPHQNIPTGAWPPPSADAPTGARVHTKTEQAATPCTLGMPMPAPHVVCPSAVVRQARTPANQRDDLLLPTVFLLSQAPCPQLSHPCHRSARPYDRPKCGPFCVWPGSQNASSC